MSDISQIDSSDGFSEAAIFSRVIEQSGEISRDLAEHMLSLSFSTNDKERIDLLLAKNTNGDLSADERTELENLNHVADLVSLWHSKARRVLKPL